ncbi:MAG: hypothetical protein COY75_10405 [Nitrospirae bacterium CG_4_10_14_0_8_um_filter_41_23]|nr:hypothetical protein [Nitrospirota bacterium]OIP58679.1 MAG: hypothetical protein AUK38_07270 [Nitrospirae bacterium CG2_30_41_42]PIQ94735.1 MAG: hypothetical protein COV68_03170 [Nitrospirae bacterium CG11_big_fil_rev_8_21_14_0_20_41_14]PIV44785.1 MAG: hypothetical protein COS27_00570 [Nitrospirae bacterium CG02_land_8_20_14_3_00_41_53]PIW87355.1 MAG: hypothetical protein COZ94_05430 [Nitrospirae bacterium CG_4_8_14_3_um_filter_41_47]PIY86022.1 MAG: hypothetical protein COY75_10405 [Nitros
MISTVISKNGKELRLTAERWSHIVEAHDYMAGNQDLVFETLENPDYIVGGGQGEFIALKHYKKTSISEKDVVVIYKEKEKEGFVITAFMTSEPERIIKKGVIWRK